MLLFLAKPASSTRAVLCSTQSRYRKWCSRDAAVIMTHFQVFITTTPLAALHDSIETASLHHYIVNRHQNSGKASREDDAYITIRYSCRCRDLLHMAKTHHCKWVRHYYDYLSFLLRQCVSLLQPLFLDFHLRNPVLSIYIAPSSQIASPAILIIFQVVRF